MNETQPDRSPLISVVVPIYKEQDNVIPLAERLDKVFRKIGCTWEIVFALDPSPDLTEERILELMEKGYPIRLITFSRRIGKPLSLLAGLDHSQGDAAVIIDADLQDPPEFIEDMIAQWREGFHVVIARRASRAGENFLYLQAAKLFYWIAEKACDVPIPRHTGDFRLLDARVVREVCRFRERHGFLRAITAAVGFPTTIVTFDRDQRHAGKTQISLMGAANIALDGIVPFSRLPVRLVFLLGAVLSVLGFGAGALWLLAGLWSGFSANWPTYLSMILSVTLSGITLASVGILGEYLVRTYEEARERPLYIIDQIRETHRPLNPAPASDAGEGESL